MESRAYDGEGNDKSQNKCKSDQLFGYSNYHVHTIGIMGCTMHRITTKLRSIMNNGMYNAQNGATTKRSIL